MAERRTSLMLRSDALEMELLTMGASIRCLRLAGVPHSLVLGAADPAFYGPANKPFFGASIGRNSNRIGRAHLPVEGEVFELSVNEPPNQLHGGATGAWARDWTVEEADERRARLSLVLPDGADGYPGEARLHATFALDGDTLTIDYEGEVDRPGPINQTSHLYFNLSGEPSTRGHELTVAAGAYLPVEVDLIPTGEVRPVEGTPFDFRAGRRMADGPELLDHNFCLDGGASETPRPVATLSAGGIVLQLATTEPGLQVYDGTGFKGQWAGLDGTGVGPYGGIAMEPQGWPDAPNHPHFPSTILHPGERYRHRSTYRFTRS